MSVNLKLEIFRVSLKKKGGRNDTLFDFKVLFNEIDKNKKKAYEKFVEGFINYFNNEFKMNADGNKGMTSSSTTRYKIDFYSNVINGEIFGGPTDMQQSIYKKNNSKKKTGNLEKDDIATLPFFFKFWTPYDHNTGVLMVQSYSNHTITELVKIHLTKYINTFGYSIIITPYIPESIAEKYKEHSNVYKITYVKERLTKDKRKLLNPLFTDFDNLKIKIEVSGFKESVNDFWDKFRKSGKTLGSNLEDFDIKEEDDYEVIAHYVDENGHKTHTSMAKNLKINPTNFLPEILKQSVSNHFDFDKIRKHTNSILNDIKIAINYK
ncbi:MAG: hypothetical protein LBP67_07820 [Bacteroidales bacterium]|jgi:hypothetical protein|nr:hypothetical protein [Bacteroidales bacterium]